MELEIRPEPNEPERAAITRALERIVTEDGVPVAYRSAWRRAALWEAADPEHEPERDHRP